MLTDWTRLDGTKGSLDVLRGSAAGVLPVAYGAGTQYLSATVPAVGGERAVGYRNDRIGQFEGPHEISALMRLSGGIGCSVALVTQWNGDDLTEQNGFEVVLETLALTGTIFSLRRGPAGTINFIEPVDVTPNTWVHLLLQIRFDRSGNQIIQIAQNDLASNLVTSPVWVGQDPTVVKRYEVRGAGRSGFVMRSGAPSSILYLGYLAVTSTLSTIT